MNLVKFNPWGDDFEKLFEGMMPSTMVPQQRMSADRFMPAVDVYDNKSDVIVEMPITHVDPDKINISIKDNMLHIKGVTEKKSELEEKNYYQREISTGFFYRTIPLPTKVLGEETNALIEDGILKISLPKAKKDGSKEIKVEVKKIRSGKTRKLAKKK